MAIIVVAGLAPRAAVADAADVTVLAPGVVFYGRPASGVIGAQDALRDWPRLAQAVAAEIPTGVTSGVLFAHFYSVGMPDFSSAEWVFVGLTGSAGEATAELLRFSFSGLRPIASYRWALPPTEIDARRATTLLLAHPRFAGAQSGHAVPDEIGGFYFFVRAATDFGGTEVLTKTGGKLVFAATTIYHGTGQLLVPPDR